MDLRWQLLIKSTGLKLVRVEAMLLQRIEEKLLVLHTIYMVTDIDSGEYIKEIAINTANIDYISMMADIKLPEIEPTTIESESEVVEE